MNTTNYNPQAELDRLIESGEVVPEAKWVAQASRAAFELTGTLYQRELKKIQRSKRLSRMQAPYMGLGEVGHLAAIEASGRVRFAFVHEQADPKVTEWARLAGTDVAHLVAVVDRLVDAVYPLVGEESLSKLVAFRKLERSGGKRMILCDLTRTTLSALIATEDGALCEIVKFSNPLRGVTMPMDTPPLLH